MEGWGIACEEALHLGSRDKSRESPRGFTAHSRGLSRLALLATNGELASRLLEEGVGGRKESPRKDTGGKITIQFIGIPSASLWRSE